MERYGSWLLGGLVAAGALLILYVAFSTGTQPAYACTAELTPGPTEANPTPRPSPTVSPSPSASPSGSAVPSSSASGSPAPNPSASAAASGSPSAVPSASASAGASASPSPVPTPEPQPTARLGFTTTDLGRNHVVNGTASISYAFCPPTSGGHYNNANAPLRPLDQPYPPSQEQLPGNWIHNLEHGYVIAAYRCPSGVLGQGDCISQAEFDELTQWIADAPPPPRSQCSTKVMAVRFDQMDTNFALLAWDRALLTDSFDAETATTFAQQWMEFESVPEGTSC